MGYRLGVDLGTTWTAAAVHRDGQTSMVELSNRSTAVPSVVLLREDDSMLIGEAADRRAALEPARVAREFKRRIGDSTPLLLGGSPYSAEALTARLLAWVVAEVARREGGPADGLVLTHPANWGDYKLDLLRQAVKLADIACAVELITEPEAAVLHYAAQERVEPGTVIGVYDLGGGTFDAAVLRKTDEGFEFLGQPEGIERLGGIDFDEAVFQRIVASVGVDLAKLDDEDPMLESALTRLRADCVVAKETLSTDSDTSIPVMLPAVQTEVRLTRAEFEAMIRPTLADTITVTQRALDSTGVGVEGVDRILLVGGSSRIPVVSELLASAFGRPLALDAHPKHAVALGAAIASASTGEASTGPVQLRPEPQPMPAAAAPASRPAPAPDPVAAPAPDETQVMPVAPAPTPVQAVPSPVQAVPAPVQPVASARPEPSPVPPGGGLGLAHASLAPGGDRRRGPFLLAGLVVLVAVAVIGLVMLGLGGEDGGEVAAGDTSSTATTAEAEASSSTTAESTTTPTTTQTTEAITTTSEATTTVPEDGFVEGVRCEVVQDLCIDLTGVSLQDGELLIEWDANFVPNIAERNHAHFFWSTVSPLDAGAGGSGNWEVSDDQPHLAGTNGEAILAVNRPPGADVCVTVANPDHTVRDPAIYQCWEYPST